MEGYPLTEFADYDNVTCSSTYSLIESMGNVQGVTWLPIITMKEELINHMKDDISNDIKLDEEEETYLDGTSDLIIKFMERFREQHKLMNNAEGDMKRIIRENQKDIEILSTFVNFLSKINEKCNQDTSEIQTNILKISNEMKEANQMKEARDHYILEKKKFRKYLNIIQLLNQMNVGSTCSICLQDNVNSYFNPCGHTSCSKCCEKNSSMNDNCPLCRTYIQSVHKLYFT
jgi:hypothetical protein